MKNNDHSGFDQLFALYHKKIYYFCLKSGLNTDESEEIVQEVFVKFWESRKNLDPSKSVQAYLYKIAKNITIDEFKRRIKQQAAEEYQLRLLQPQNDTQNNVAYNELEQLITNTLRNFPEKRRLVFELSRHKGLSNKEVAREMGISVKAVEEHIKLALQNFRSIFKKSEIISVSLIFLVDSLFSF